MKKAFRILWVLPFVAVFFVLKGCIIQNPSPEDCDVKEITVRSISEGGTYDIVFTESNGDFYYINRGIEQGLTLEGMEDKVLNKNVTLHLANTIMGTSNHIAQLAIDDEIVYTEFKSGN